MKCRKLHFPIYSHIKCTRIFRWPLKRIRWFFLTKKSFILYLFSTKITTTKASLNNIKALILCMNTHHISIYPVFFKDTWHDVQRFDFHVYVFQQSYFYHFMANEAAFELKKHCITYIIVLVFVFSKKIFHLGLFYKTFNIKHQKYTDTGS